MKILIFSALLFSFNAHSEDGYPYILKETGYADTPGSETVILPNTPIKSQDGIGICYGFSTTSLLENYRCSMNGSSCQDSSDLLSSLDVTSNGNPGRLVEGGVPGRILSNISSKLKVAKEECVRFAALVHEYSDSGLRYRNERGGWKILVEKWREFKGLKQDTPRNDCVTCMADAIKSTLVNVQTPREQIIEAFNSSSSLEQFLYKSLLPAQCLNDANMATIPRFVAKSFPTYKDQLTVDSLSKKIETILLNGMPLEIGICTGLQEEGKCYDDRGHSVALFGIKESCSRINGDCKTMVKVKNSYGQSWQEQNDDGWVDLRTLAESSIALSKNGNINWIEKPGFVLQNKSLSKSSSSSSSSSTYIPPRVINSPGKSPAGVPSEYKNYKGIWKCPGNAFMDHYEPGCTPMGR